MKWRQLCMSVALLTALTLPASAVDYTVEGPDAGLFGRPTSDETIYINTESANVDKSKNTALLPPGFGTATSYLPGCGAPLTPDASADDWTVVGGGTASDPEYTVPTTAFTAVASNLYYGGGYLGTLKIPAIGLTVKVYEGTGSTPLSKGAGHFEGTSIWDGNVCLAGHNRGVTNHFGKIHKLSPGNKITFATKLGTRTYQVISVAQVNETDRSGLATSADNRITLYTCVVDRPALRWCVQAVEV